MKKIFKDYFTFTKSERNGIVVLLLVVLLVIFFPQIRGLFVSEKQTDFTAFKKDIAEFEKETKSTRSDSSVTNTASNDSAKTIKLFYFNPNKITAAQWVQLGVNKKIATIIQHYLSKGGSFRKAEDLKKIYGFTNDDYNRLAPYVKLETENKPVENNSLVDINKADSLELCSLKGIGPKSSSRIIQFRKKLGGFFSTNQLLDIYGIRPGTIDKIKDEIMVSAPKITPISVNNSSIEDLSKNPYLPYSIAKAVVDYRTQHGNFKKLSEIKNCPVVDDSLYKRVAPYLSL